MFAIASHFWRANNKRSFRRAPYGPELKGVGMRLAVDAGKTCEVHQAAASEKDPRCSIVSAPGCDCQTSSQDEEKIQGDDRPK
jgi:hypothetical protein